MTKNNILNRSFAVLCSQSITVLSNVMTVNTSKTNEKMFVGLNFVFHNKKDFRPRCSDNVPFLSFLRIEDTKLLRIKKSNKISNNLKLLYNYCTNILGFSSYRYHLLFFVFSITNYSRSYIVV
jgi:hypothetical protein